MRWLGAGGVVLLVLLVWWAGRDDPVARTGERKGVDAKVARAAASTTGTSMPGPEAKPEPGKEEGRPKRTVEVALRWADGRPAAGVTVVLMRGATPTARRRTDTRGVARLRVPEKRYWCWARFDPEKTRWPGRNEILVGRVRDPGDVRIDHVFPPLRDLVVRVTGKTGTPRNPRVERPELLDIQTRDGEIRGRFAAAGREVVVAVRADGYAPRAVTVPLEAGSHPVVAQIELATSVAVFAHVTGYRGEIAPLVLRGKRAGTVERTGPFEWQVVPGRHTMRLYGSGVLVKEVVAKSQPVHEEIDLSDVRELVIDVQIPAGFDRTHLGLRVKGRDVRRGHATKHFRLLVPGDHTLEITPTHPLLRPADDGGIVETRGGGRATVRMVSKPLIRFALSEPTDQPVAVRFGPPGTPSHRLIYIEQRAHGTGYAVAVPRLGRYKVEVHLRHHRPHVVEDLAVTGAGVDLGTITLTTAARGR